MPTKKSLIIIGRRVHFQRAEKGFYDALKRQFYLKTIFIEDGWPSKAEDISDFKDYDAWIWYVPFRDLMTRPGFEWGDFPGFRIMYDLDATQNNHRLLASGFFGAWPEVFHRNEFHLLVCTGRQTRDSLIADGVPSYWLPKAYDPSRLFNLERERHGICYFGNRYVSRRAMLHYLERKRVSFDTFRCAPDKLNEHLNQYLGCLICNMAGTVRPGIGRLIHHFLQSFGVALEAGAEPMLKNFEVAGAGCAPITDWIDELAELGFEDGKTMVSYRSFEELVEKLRYYLDEPATLHQIGLSAAKLVLERHTWDHRARQLQELLIQQGV